MADPDPLRDTAKGGRGPAVQSGASDLGMFAPTPFGLAMVGGPLALTTGNASAMAGPASSQADALATPTGGSADFALAQSAGVQAFSSAAIMPDIPALTGIVSIVSPVTQHGATPPAADATGVLSPDPAMAGPERASDGDPVTTPVKVSPIAEAVTGSGAVATPQIIETIAAIRATADQLNEQLNGAIDALADRVGSDLEDAVSATSAAVLDIGSRVETITGRIAEAGDRVDDAIGGVSQTIAELSDATGAVLGTAQSGVADVTAALSSRLNDTTGALSDTIDSTLDLTGLGGGDPAGGIATLTALLSSSDGFELGEPDLPEPVFASVGETASVLEGVGDTIADLPLPDVPGLLGNQSGLLGGLLDDDGDGHG